VIAEAQNANPLAGSALVVRLPSGAAIELTNASQAGVAAAQPAGDGPLNGMRMTQSDIRWNRRFSYGRRIVTNYNVTPNSL
jgi:hypothetical protein